MIPYEPLENSIFYGNMRNMNQVFMLANDDDEAVSRPRQNLFLRAKSALKIGKKIGITSKASLVDEGQFVDQLVRIIDKTSTAQRFSAPWYGVIYCFTYG